MTDYCTVAEVKTYLGIAGAADDALIGTLITAVSRAFDTATGYTFGATVDTSLTHYCYDDDVYDQELLFLQPFTTVTSIVNGDGVTLSATADYLLKPRTTPYTTAVFRPQSSAYWTDGADYDGIVVTGSVGYPLTEDIKQACILWAAFMFGQKDNPLIDITAIEVGAVISTPHRPKYTTSIINYYKDMRPSG